MRVKSTANGKEGLVGKCENGVLDGGIGREEDIAGIEISVVDKFSG